MPVTINEVAKEAGVSITTVSRVLNNNYPVKKETRERIEEAIKKLNYKPNIMARGLITKKTSVIGVVVPGITNLFFSTIVESIENQLKKFGYNIFLSNIGSNVDELEVIGDVVARQVDGIIIIDPPIDEEKEKYYEKICSEIPMIIVNGDTAKKPYNSVSYDEERGAMDAFEYLTQLGHEKILFIRGNQSLSYDIKEKVYNKVIEENNLQYRQVLNVGDGNSIEVVEKTEMEFEKFIKDNDKPTAVFACNDLMALGVLNICSKYGIKIPDDMSIIGFDNTLISNITRPRITSVDQNMIEVAQRAASSLVKLIDTSNKGRVKVNLKTKLIYKESCCEIKF